MRKYFYLLMLPLFMTTLSYAQNVPAGMKYQAVARNTSGEVLPNRNITLRIELKSDPAKGSVVYYSEEHTVVTNQFGLFDLVVGMGKSNKGIFAAVPWSSEDIWMAVSLKEKETAFSAVTESRLLAVPYAFHALTASAIANAAGKETPNVATPGVPANVWSLQGNYNSDPTKDKLGTTDYKDLVMVTNNLERFRITKDGDISINNSLKVGKDVEVGNDLYVKKNVFLNTTEGGTTISGATLINNTLAVTKNASNFVATITNTNTGDGDGLLIKLNKTHPGWNGNSYLNVPSPSEVFDGAISTIKGWVLDHETPSASDLLDFIPATYVATLGIQLVNTITDRMNDIFNLPVTIGPWDVCFGELGCVDIIPEITLIPEIPKINIGGLPSFSVPNINFNNVNNSLTNKNQFISFVDKDNRELGSVRAQSVMDWREKYLDGTFFVNLMAGMVGIDVVNGVANAIAGFTNMAKSYNNIGVEYSSGNGDYAEWLERTNPFEIINAGDIVGVRGGKVSKNLEGAEQILAVSHNPIVLGNAQSKEREPYGNKIAFTGQVPVKVVGPVNMGDYIIAKGEFQGYGIAIKPADLTTNDLKLAVGRSWETNLNEGPKMVNTLIGVDNGDYIKIMKESQDKIEAMEIRMKTMEEKMNNLFLEKGKRKGSKRKLVNNI